jgi:hypothetical protein
MEPKTHFGPFYGQDLTPEEADALAIGHITGKALALEADLMDKKWFDYRLLHPTVATYLFAQCYTTGYQRFIRVSQDADRAQFVKGFKGKDFFDSREKRSFWQVRQRIDEVGIRYDYFMNRAVEYCIDNGWRQPPRPSHIYSDADLMLYVMNQWAAECKGRLQFPKDAFYRVENFTGQRHQLAFEKWILEQVAMRQQRQYSLHTAIHLQGMLRIEPAIERFGAETVRSAVDYALEQYTNEEV